MSISNTSIATTPAVTTIFNAVTESIVLSIMLCNTSAGDLTVTLHACKSNASAADENMFLKEQLIPDGDTFVWASNEKLLLDATDVIRAVASGTGITATISYRSIE